VEKELEVKILNMDFDKLEKKILDLGGNLIAEENQINTLIDSNKKPIKSYSNSYLRIRETENILNKDKKIELTLKKNISTEGLRDNIEYTTEIKDRESMLKILNELGLDFNEIGYKKRKSYTLKGARFDFDTWDDRTYPYPYMEIEVDSRKRLNEITSLLEIPQENISFKSIVELKKEIKLV
jgi:adenylate cyclase, class 2